MKKPLIPANETERLNAIYEYNILDSLTEEDYDTLTFIASQICQTPISLISLVDKDRQWFKAHHGLSVSETPRDFSFCAHAINTPDQPFIIENSKLDERFADNPLVTKEPNVIFYAGIPLLNDDGYALGTLCVIDNEPNKLNEGQIKALKGLAKQVINLMELRKKKYILENLNESLNAKNQKLETFTMVAAHDLKSPLKNISTLIDVVMEDYSDSIDLEKQKILGMLKKSSNNLLSLVDGMLEYCRIDRVLDTKKSEINFDEFINQVVELFSGTLCVEFNVEKSGLIGFLNKTALSQILINIISNAIKYNDKIVAKIDIKINEIPGFWKFDISDNGPGIEEKYHQKIFEMFQVLNGKDKFGEKGNGIGLSSVKILVEKMGGEISIQSKLGEGTRFIFTIEK